MPRNRTVVHAPKDRSEVFGMRGARLLRGLPEPARNVRYVPPSPGSLEDEENRIMREITDEGDEE